MVASMRQLQIQTMNPLETVTEGRSVSLLTDIRANFHLECGSNSDYQRIESAMVDRAHRDPVGDDGIAALGVALDVSGLQ